MRAFPELFLTEAGRSTRISPFPSFSRFNTESIGNSRIFSCRASSAREAKAVCALLAAARGSRKGQVRGLPTDQGESSYLHMLSLTFFFLPYSAHFFTAHRIPSSISCSHQHLQSIISPSALAPDSPFSATILIMSRPSSCNPFTSLPNFHQALQTPIVHLTEAGFHPVPPFLLKGCSAAGISGLQQLVEWAPDVTKSCNECFKHFPRYWQCEFIAGSSSV